MTEKSLLALLASPVQKSTAQTRASGNKHKLSKGSFSLDNICKLMAESERRIVDLSAINQRVIKQLEAVEEPTELGDIKHLLKNAAEFGLDDSTSDESDKASIFTCEPNTVFRIDLLYRKARVKQGNITDLIEKQPDDVAKAKIALRVLSMDKNEQRLGTGKAYLARQNIRVQLHRMFPTVIKILINYGIDPTLLDEHVFHFSNIKQNCRMRARRSKNTTLDSLNANELYSCLPQVLDCFHLLLDDKLLDDFTLVHDYVSIIFLLFIDHTWNSNRSCMRTLKQFLLNFLKRIPRTVQALETCTEALLKFLKSYPYKVIAFISFLPNDTQFSRRLKTSVCMEALEKLNVQADTSVSGVCIVLEQLHECPLNDKDRNLVMLFIKELVEDMNLSPTDEQKLGKTFRALADGLLVDRDNRDSIATYRTAISLGQMYQPEEEKSVVESSPPKKAKRGRPKKSTK
jgi:hypothetical protein